MQASILVGRTCRGAFGAEDTRKAIARRSNGREEVDNEGFIGAGPFGRLKEEAEQNPGGDGQRYPNGEDDFCGARSPRWQLVEH